MCHAVQVSAMCYDRVMVIARHLDLLRLLADKSAFLFGVLTEAFLIALWNDELLD